MSTLKKKDNERQTDVNRLGKIDGEVIESLVDPLEMVKLIEADYSKMQDELKAKGRELEEARIEVRKIRLSADRERHDTEQRLKGGAIAGLAEFISEVTGIWGLERHKWQATAPRDADGVPLPARVRIEQLNDITARAQALYLEPDADTAEAELVRLRIEVQVLPAPPVAMGLV